MDATASATGGDISWTKCIYAVAQWSKWYIEHFVQVASPLSFLKCLLNGTM